MKPIVRNIIIAVIATGVLVGLFLFTFLPTTQEIYLSGDFLLSGNMYTDTADDNRQEKQKLLFLIKQAL